MSGAADPVRVTYHITLDGPRDGEFEIGREEWNRLTPDGRERLIDNVVNGKVGDIVDRGIEVTNADVDDPTARWF